MFSSLAGISYERSVQQGVHISCGLSKRLSPLHYEISLIEEARSRLAAHRAELLDRRSLVILNIDKLRGECGLGDSPNNESLALIVELKEILVKLKENSREGEWLEIQFAAKKHALATAHLLHVVVSI